MVRALKGPWRWRGILAVVLVLGCFGLASADQATLTASAGSLALAQARTLAWKDTTDSLGAFVTAQQTAKTPLRGTGLTNDFWQYSFESHVTPVPGFNLGMHRIYRRDLKRPDLLPAVFLQHGLLDTSASFIAAGGDRALSFALAAAGYDVWLGNLRGNVFSIEAGSRDDDSEVDRWFFSTDDHALVDFRAMLLYVTRLRKSDIIHSYIGHSMGSCISFLGIGGLVPGSTYIRAHEELGGVGPLPAIQIKNLIALGPSVYTPDLTLPGWESLASKLPSLSSQRLEPWSFLKTIDRKGHNRLSWWIAHLTTNGVSLGMKAAPTVCAMFPSLCKPVFCAIAYCGSHSHWDNTFGTLLKFTPGATSWNVLMYFAEHGTPEREALLLPPHMLDASLLNVTVTGPDGVKQQVTNQYLYQAEKPPSYDLCQVLQRQSEQPNIVIIYSPEDPLVKPPGITALAHKLQACGSRFLESPRAPRLVQLDDFGHIDFTLGTDEPCTTGQPTLLAGASKLAASPCSGTLNSFLVRLLNDDLPRAEDVAELEEVVVRSDAGDGGFGRSAAPLGAGGARQESRTRWLLGALSAAVLGDDDDDSNSEDDEGGSLSKMEDVD